MNFSIIIPCYNGEIWLEGIFESIKNLSTSYSYEIIFVNDGSTDNTKDELERLLVGCSRAKVLTHVSNQGLAASRNTGIKESTGEWVIFLDCDDFLDVRVFDQMLEFGDASQADVVWANYKTFSNNDDIKKEKLTRKALFINSGKVIEQSLLQERIPLALCTGIYKRKFLLDEKLFFNKELRFAEDQCFIAELLTISQNYYYCEDVSHYYRVGHVSLSSQSVKKRISALVKIYSILSSRGENSTSKLFIERRLRVWLGNNVAFLPILEWRKFLAFEILRLNIFIYLKHMSQKATLKSLLRSVLILACMKIKACLYLMLNVCQITPREPEEF